MLSPSNIAEGNTKIKFIMVEPIKVPEAKPKLPDLEDVIATESSGSVVPKETTIIPTTSGDILKILDNLTDSLTNSCVAKSSITTPNKNFAIEASI